VAKLLDGPPVGLPPWVLNKDEPIVWEFVDLGVPGSDHTHVDIKVGEYMFTHASWEGENLAKNMAANKLGVHVSEVEMTDHKFVAKDQMHTFTFKKTKVPPQDWTQVGHNHIAVKIEYGLKHPAHGQAVNDAFALAAKHLGVPAAALNVTDAGTDYTSKQHVLHFTVKGKQAVKFMKKKEDLPTQDDGTLVMTGPITVLNTDGGSNLMKEVGAFAWTAVIPGGRVRTRSVAVGDVTNNQMELRAVIDALEELEIGSEIHLRADSEYVLKGMQYWGRSWRANGWKTKDGNPIKNKDLWERLLGLKDLHRITYEHVDGHTGDTGNEMVDSFCTQAIAAGVYEGLETGDEHVVKDIDITETGSNQLTTEELLKKKKKKPKPGLMPTDDFNDLWGITPAEGPGA
jgi:ribonuclease HI